MRRTTQYAVILYFMLLNAISISAQNDIVWGRVVDKQTGEPIDYATVFIENTNKAMLTGDGGQFAISTDGADNVRLQVSFVGYQTQTIDCERGKNLIVRLEIQENKIGEIVVTAHESHGITTASKITRAQMDHVQPTSISDLMSMLPGGMSHDPVTNKVNSISMRETGVFNANGEASTGNDYSISSLGTAFLIDGAPINTDANMQKIQGSTNYSISTMNRGVDMRTLSTDDIESIEVIRGIPSAEHGNMTSGMVIINKVRKKTPWTARIKADQYGKLMSIGKGFAIGKDVLNLNISYLAATPDVRNTYEKYKRITISARQTIVREKDDKNITITPSAEFTGSFDNKKKDPDLTYSDIDEYKSSYRRTAMACGLKTNEKAHAWLKGFSADFSASYQHDVLKETKIVNPKRASIAPNAAVGIKAYNLEDELIGTPTEASYLPGQYQSKYICDGKPFNTYTKFKIEGRNDFANITLNEKAGVEWNMSKNLGNGMQYDISLPPSDVWKDMPRKYKDIPALQSIASFAECNIFASIGRSKIEALAGVRMQKMLGLTDKYENINKPYFDPRINMLFTLPSIANITISIGGGYGITTKMPTQNYISPDYKYINLVGLNYYNSSDINQSIVKITSYVISPENFALKAARNTKKELRIDIAAGSNRLSITYFNEKTANGYRYEEQYASYSYDKYDNHEEPLTSHKERVLEYVSMPTNNAFINKEGIEYQYQSSRIKAIRTAIVVNGAWYNSKYHSKVPYFEPISTVINEKAIQDYYVGQYSGQRGNKAETFNTNVMLDTQIPEIGFTFSTTIENMWFQKTQRLKEDEIPSHYISYDDGKIHTYEKNDTEDIYLKHLVRQKNDAIFRQYTIPRATHINLKATKKIGSIARISMFANRLLSSTPSYKRDGNIVRRHISPYFGMEINITL